MNRYIHPAAPTAAALALAAIVATIAPQPSPAQTAAEKAKAAPAKAASAKDVPVKAAPAKAEKPAPRGEQAIVVLVNDEPITAYEIEQRASFIALSSGGGGGPDLKAKAEARWAQIMQDPKTNDRFQQLLRDKNVRTREEAQAVQKQYLTELQKGMIDQLRRESRASVMPKLRKDAQEELIEERLRLQEAKRLGIEVSEDEVKGVVKGLAERNKMTYEQFAQHLKGLGVDISTLAERFKGQMAWRQAIQRRYSSQVSVTQRDIDRMLSSAAIEAGEDAVELHLHKIAIALPGKIDQAAMATRFSEAEGLRRKFNGCKSMGDLAKALPNAKFEDMKFVKPGAVAEPTRSMLLGAKDGDMLPPITAGSGIEIYAVCARRTIAADEAQRQKAQEELKYQEIDILAKRHMRNLRQDASIDYR